MNMGPLSIEIVQNRSIGKLYNCWIAKTCRLLVHHKLGNRQVIKESAFSMSLHAIACVLHTPFNLLGPKEGETVS
jgi:hypothetical protein